MNEGIMQGTPEDYEAIIQSLKDYAVFTTDKNGLITTWSAGAVRILLYEPQDIIGRGGEILYTAEDIAAEVPAHEFQNALADGKAVNERFHVKKDRSRFWGSGLVFPLYNKSAEHIGFTKVMQNSSDADQAEANLREESAMAEALVAAYPEPIVVLNAAMTVVNTTASFIQYFSMDKQNIIGKNFYDIADGGLNMTMLRALLENVIKSNNFHSSFELTYEHPQKGIRSVLVKPRRVYQRPNELFSLEFEDRTDDNALMEEKDVFISVASHEIRTPISVIKAYAQILERELKDAKPIVRKAIQKINEQVTYLSALITSLLDTSKIKTGKLLLDPEVFELCGLVKEQVESFAVTQVSHRITVNHETDCIVFADKIRVASVINNLLSNAVKYSPQASEVDIYIGNEPEHQVKVSVRDFGLGIPADEQHKIFQRFGRTDSIKKSKIPGTGLGLHLSAEIIRLSGGTTGFTSEEGGGSTFYFTLPLY
ncbi:sensor histidine kinase [Mucilaginibacter aquaedulcis]|uniref:sensor histidine kinase n=1 Tax=Mucilaginibacter aquaedulcis TaxID=1187081 RepID=UPI0025B4BEBC|nr:ATP-binding protein [Mucilaginibacter aquaedulcis]MDN3547849.1 ATP-binding protein [Mucilaginibacter aquaedulcis]